MIANKLLHQARGGAQARRQRGVVMYVALIVLIAMTLAGIAMMRQMSTGVSVAGNVAFRQNATSAADLGVEAARSWYTSTSAPPNLNVSAADSGYYASWGDGTDPKDDPTTFPWTDAGSVKVIAASDEPTGNEVRYVLQRLCALTGKPPTFPTQKCSDSGLNQSADKGGDPAAEKKPPSPYFRVTVRVAGPRNTVSYVQVIMN